MAWQAETESKTILMMETGKVTKMYLEEKTNRGTTLVPLKTRLLSTRCIMLTGDITKELVDDIFLQMTYLQLEDTKTPIRVYFDSPGGSIEDGLVLLDLFETSKAPVEMYCLGKAMSMAGLIFAAGTHGRYMLPNSQLMLHEPYVHINGNGSLEDVASLTTSMKHTREHINRILAKATGKTEKQIEKAIQHDRFFSGEEAVEFGLCDAVIGYDEYLEKIGT